MCRASLGRASDDAYGDNGVGWACCWRADGLPERDCRCCRVHCDANCGAALGQPRSAPCAGLVCSGVCGASGAGGVLSLLRNGMGCQAWRCAGMERPSVVTLSARQRGVQCTQTDTIAAAATGDDQVRSFDGTVASALADISREDDMALARFRGLVWGVQGIAATSGPIIGTSLAVISPRLAYLAAAVTSVVIALLVSLTPETLSISERQPFRWSMINPFAFIQLLLGVGPYRKAAARRKIQALGISNGLMMLPIFGSCAKSSFVAGLLQAPFCSIAWFLVARCTSDCRCGLDWSCAGLYDAEELFFRCDSCTRSSIH
jgi:hypothetical protein